MGVMSKAKRSGSGMRWRTPLLAAAAVVAMPWTAAAQMPPPSHKQVPFDARVGAWVVPGLQSWTAGEGRFELTAKSRIVLPAGASAALRADAARLAADLAQLSGLALPVATGAARDGDIVLTVGDPAVSGQSAEAYRMAVGKRIEITAADPAGHFYAGRSLLQLLRQDKGRRSLAQGVAADWPNAPRRAMMVDVGRKYFEVDQLERLITQLGYLKINTLGLHFTDWPAFRLKSERHPGLSDRLSYDRADIARLEAAARRNHIMLIPEIDLPAHASAIIRYRPSLAFQCESMRQSEWLSRSAREEAGQYAWTIDITREENRAFMRDLLDEFIPWFSGPYFHIGGDEYQYDADKTRCPELMAYTKARGFAHPGDVFVDWINETNRFVRAKGKQTVIWNWWRFKDDKTSIEPDKNILIYAWNAPREQAILDSGYEMIISPEDKLYVVPGIENFDGGGYGVVDTDKVYNQMEFRSGKGVAGYMVALWNDAAENRTDSFLIGKAYEPVAVVAERLWSGKGSTSLDAFLARLNGAGLAPPESPTPPIR